MSKSILIIDTPKECWECPLHTEGFDDDFEDIMMCGETLLESHYGSIPSWCPLKPLPEKKEEIPFEETKRKSIFGEQILLDKMMKLIRAKGYNECLKDILGEE